MVALKKIQVSTKELAPQDFEIVFSAANYLREAGDYARAEAMYQVAAELRPDVSWFKLRRFLLFPLQI